MPQSYEDKKQQERDRWEKWNKANPGVASKRMTRWKKDNPDKVKLHTRRARFKRYGLTIEAFEGMLSAQGYRCKVCNKDRLPTEREWQVDHCHKSGTVRGILCYNCNVGLGHFHDDKELLQAAINYLGVSCG